MNSEPTNLLPVILGEVFDSLPESVRYYIRFLEATIQQQQIQIQQQQIEIQQLRARVHELEARLSKNSSNSSKPPGSDGLKKLPKSLRGKSDKKQGAQKGHIGKSLAAVEKPDLIVNHTPASCSGCGLSLAHVNGVCTEKRQVVDIPQPKIAVTEHRLLEKRCPHCGELCRAPFPENIRGPVQYGAGVQSVAAYLMHQQFIPVERTCQVLNDLFGIDMSPGTCSNIDKKLFKNLEPFEISLKVYLLAARTLHFDETGMRSEKKLRWIHVASSQLATLYTMHVKRGQEAMNEAGILPHFKGNGIHDHWFPYFAYEQITHGLCNAHHLRELVFIHEQEKEDWALEMKDLLIFAKSEVERHFDQGTLPQTVLLHVEEMYSQILSKGLLYHSLLPPLPKKGKRGRHKQRDGKNLLDRFEKKRSCVLRFMYDFSVSFTNNQGEQDIRMVKLRQKISGCFRTSHGGQIFCRIRSYLSTARKQGWNILEALSEAIRGCPRLLDIHQNATVQAIVA